MGPKSCGSGIREQLGLEILVHSLLQPEVSWGRNRPAAWLGQRMCFLSGSLPWVVKLVLDVLGWGLSPLHVHRLHSAARVSSWRGGWLPQRSPSNRPRQSCSVLSDPVRERVWSEPPFSIATQISPESGKKTGPALSRDYQPIFNSSVAAMLTF